MRVRLEAEGPVDAGTRAMSSSGQKALSPPPVAAAPKEVTPKPSPAPAASTAEGVFRCESRIPLPKNTTVYVGKIPESCDETCVNFLIKSCGLVRHW